VRGFLRFFFRVIFRVLSKVKITGKENVPEHSAYLIAINHVSLYEAPLIGAFWPHPPEAMGASDVWDRPGQSLIARWYGGIPVHRGEYDRRLIETVLSVLRSGYPLMIAPEGTRSHEPGMQRAMPGIAYLMDKANVPVVPVGVVGSTEDYLSKALHGKRPDVEIRIGKAIHLPPVTGKGSKRRLDRQKNADLVMAHIAALLPPEYRGVYAGHEYLTKLNTEARDFFQK
jgi:1-acyl-sn-glycerol-3-phosphate acyltransferase